jgi:hypothetical protein
MLGYSQGSHVIHEIVLQLNAEERNHISSVVLVADAIRNPDDKGPLSFMGSQLKFESRDTVLNNGMGVMRVAALADLGCVAYFTLTDPIKSLGSIFRFVTELRTPSACALLLPKDVRFSDVVSVEDFPDDLDRKVLNVCIRLDIVCNAEFKGEFPLALESALVLDALKGVNANELHGESYKREAFYNFPASWRT